MAPPTSAPSHEDETPTVIDGVMGPVTRMGLEGEPAPAGLRVPPLGDGLIPLAELRAGLHESPGEGPAPYGLDAALAARRRILKREHRVHGVPTPFLGRRRELEALYNLVRDSVNEGQLRSASVVGGAGVGKSRLLAEVLAVIDPEARGIAVLAAEGKAGQPDDGFQVVSQIIRQRFGIGPRDVARTAHERILEGIEPLVEPRHMATALRHLATLAGFRPFAGEVSEQRAGAGFHAQALKTFVNLLRYDVRQNPLVLVVQRCDVLSQAEAGVLLATVEALRDTPTVLILSGERPPPDALCDASPDHARMVLDKLPSDVMDRLARALLSRVEDLHDGLVQGLVDHSHGLPRLLEDNLRLLVQQGVLETGTDVWTHDRAKGKGAVLAMGLEAAAEARVRALPPETRRLLEMAAVLGSPCWRGGLLAMVRAEGTSSQSGSVRPWSIDPREAALGERLDEAIRRELLRPAPETMLEDEVAFTFRREVDRAALYGGLEASTRARYHRLAAQWLAGLPLRDRGPWQEVIAWHLVRGGATERAAERYVRSGDAARDVHDLSRARTRYREAVSLVGDDRLDVVMKALEGWGSACMASGAFDEALTVYGPLLEASLAAGVPLVGASSWLRLGRAKRGLGDYEGARVALGEAWRLAKANDGPVLVAAARTQLGMVLRVEGGPGAYQQAMQHHEAALRIRRRLSDHDGVAESLGALAAIHLQRGELGEAAAKHQEALDLRRRAGDRAGEAATLLGLGNVAYARRFREGALANWHRALDLAEQVGDRQLAAKLGNNVGETYLELGDRERARANLEEALTTARDIGDLRTEAEVRRNLGALAVAEAAWGAALQHVDASLALADRLGSAPARGVALRTCGELLAKVPAGAKVDLLMGRKRPEGARDVYTPADADQAFEQAVAVFEELGSRFELGRTLTSWAEWRMAKGQTSGAKELLDKAKRLLSH